MLSIYFHFLFLLEHRIVAVGVYVTI